MELRPALRDKLERMIDKGVCLPNPLTVDIGDEVDVDRISHEGVKIYPGCRIYGDRTVISAGAVIGREGPVTVEDCQIGPGVELGSGCFNMSVFLQRSKMGPGAQVREACILEEQSSSAHCVGLKQTILFPFVTLGSLINFCDCLMAGGTSRKDHSEVGSSYIHFNFTPGGDKATASLLGDVPRGVMLNQPPIFLGGQGGMVGPLLLGFGNVVAAGCVLHRDIRSEGKLIFEEPHTGSIADYRPHAYPSFSRIVYNNFVYIANLAALEQWYIHVRRPFFKEQELGELVYEGALEKLSMAMAERFKRLEDMAKKLGESSGDEDPARRAFEKNAGRLCELLEGGKKRQEGLKQRDLLLDGLQKSRKRGAGYIETIQSLEDDVLRVGTDWLEQVVEGVKRSLLSLVPVGGSNRG